MVQTVPAAAAAERNIEEGTETLTRLNAALQQPADSKRPVSYMLHVGGKLRPNYTTAEPSRGQRTTSAVLCGFCLLCRSGFFFFGFFLMSRVHSARK